MALGLNTVWGAGLLALAVAACAAMGAYAGEDAAPGGAGKRPVIILKLDDVTSKGLKGKTPVHGAWQTVYDYLKGRGIVFSAGVHGETMELDHQPTYDWIKEKHAEGSIEFWCHGFKSARDKLVVDGQPTDQLEPGEFERGYDEQYALLRKCQDLAKEKLGFTFNAFGPHWSGVNDDTARALKAVPEFTIWLYANEQQGEASGKYPYPRYMAVEYRTHVPDFGEFKKQWESRGKMRDALVLQGHPKSWMWEEGRPRYLEFQKIIDFLVEQGCEFMTPTGYYEARGKALAEEAKKPLRSALYPEDWTPGFATPEGDWLPDFSYAGYRRSVEPLPPADTPAFADATAAPYGADPTGAADATDAIQRALDAAGTAGGGVVFLPAGTYRLRYPTPEAEAALWVRHANVVLRGAGADKTRLFLDADNTRQKAMILARPDPVFWWFTKNDLDGVAVTADLLRTTRDIPVESVDGYAVGDRVLLRTVVNDAFINEHGMEGKWKVGQWAMRGMALPRRVEALDAERKVIRLDAPTYYEMRVSDGTRLRKIPETAFLTGVGFEDFSMGMKEMEGVPDWTDRDHSDNTYADENQPAHRLHFSIALSMKHCEDGFVRRVNSYLPEGNRKYHIHSNGVRLDYSTRVTVADCDWRDPQYRGGGGNGYLFTLNGVDNLVRDCNAVRGRHNYDLQGMHTAGNVIHRSATRDGHLPADYHMYLSTGNLVDQAIVDGDVWECRPRHGSGGAMSHGESGAGNVFWNTEGVRYREGRNFVVDSIQPRRGMVIGTRGPANQVSWRSNGLKELVAQGDRMAPQSLWLDQLERRGKRDLANDTEE